MLMTEQALWFVRLILYAGLSSCAAMPISLPSSEVNLTITPLSHVRTPRLGRELLTTANTWRYEFDPPATYTDPMQRLYLDIIFDISSFCANSFSVDFGTTCLQNCRADGRSVFLLVQWDLQTSGNAAFAGDVDGPMYMPTPAGICPEPTPADTCTSFGLDRMYSKRNNANFWIGQIYRVNTMSTQWCAGTPFVRFGLPILPRFTPGWDRPDFRSTNVNIAFYYFDLRDYSTLEAAVDNTQAFDIPTYPRAPANAFTSRGNLVNTFNTQFPTPYVAPATTLPPTTAGPTSAPPTTQPPTTANPTTTAAQTSVGHTTVPQHNAPIGATNPSAANHTATIIAAEAQTSSTSEIQTIVAIQLAVLVIILIFT